MLRKRVGYIEEESQISCGESKVFRRKFEGVEDENGESSNKLHAG